MKIKKIENFSKFENYLSDFENKSLFNIVKNKKEFQNFYYIYLKNNLLGFLDLHYLSGKENAFLSVVFIQPNKQKKFDILDLLPLVENKALEMGAKILQHNLQGESVIDSLRENEWNVLQATYLIEKHLV